jgi:hypothetical protein
MRLDKTPAKVFLHVMSVAVANDRSRDIQGEAHDMTKRQVQEWFNWMDRILDIHRGNFVFRPSTSKELEEHKTVLKLSIRCCLMINALIADPDFNDPDLTARLKIRIQQLQDAYDTFHDAALSDEQAEKILKQVFPG